MTRFKVTIVETYERVFQDIELEAPSFDAAERLATQLETEGLTPTYDDVVEVHREVDLA